MNLELQAARVIVSGGGSNIGRGIVHGFAREGAKVAICDIDGEQAERVRAEAMMLGALDAIVVADDLTAEGAGTRTVATVVERWGGVDALVNNAGWSDARFFAKDTDRARWQKTVEINLFIAIGMTQAVLEPMRSAKSGSIVFISSDAAGGEVRQGIYGMTKAGVIALAKTVAKEHGRHGIRSNVISPGLVLPESSDAVGASSLWAADPDTVFNEKQIEDMKRLLLLGKLTTANDVADAVTWISSNRASQITGQVLSVNGGYNI